VALVRCIPALHKLRAEGDAQIGISIVTRALEEPLRMIVANAGHEGAVVVEKVKLNSNQNYGFNAETESFGDLVEEGVIDPTMVTRAALQNAASIASLLLTTEALVGDYPEKEDNAPAGSPGGMGGGMY
jgi:chaperonin GroEL